MDKGPKIEFRGDHIHIEIGSDLRVDSVDADEYWSKLRAICDEHGTRRVLVEGIAPKGEFGCRDIVEAGLRTAKVPNLWLAYSLEGYEPTEQSELYEVIAGSHGIRVKFFTDSGSALKWLRSNAPA
jgi:hypothetical protein